MGKTLENATPEKAVAEVVRYGERLILPESMKIPVAIELLERRMKYEQEEVALQETFLAFPWDGAHAMDKVLTEMFGWTPAEPIPGFFGPTPPQMISVEVSVNEVIQVPWGRFSLPNVNGWVQSGAQVKDGRVCFHLTGKVKRDSEKTVRAFFDRIREFLRTNSIYRGKAIKIRFRDEFGEPLDMPEPKFLDTASIDPKNLIYSKDIERDIEVNLFTPIRRHKDLAANNMAIKRGVLLGGTYGCGKTLAAFVASKYAVEAGLTFIYVTRADELSDAINFAKLYSEPAAVLFCEDIDRALQGERSVRIDDILNIIDGIDTKRMNLITVLTTNHLDNINAAMLRPGRLDSIIHVTPPDAEAAERLLRHYAGGAISADEDLTEAAANLEGTIPATIAEVVKRAKLARITELLPGEHVRNLTGTALAAASFTMKTQNDLLEKASAPKAPPPAIETLIGEIVESRLHNGRTRITGQVEGIGPLEARLTHHAD
jgi:transitional endoplasmic reticulum ATPase